MQRCNDARKASATAGNAHFRVEFAKLRVQLEARQLDAQLQVQLVQRGDHAVHSLDVLEAHEDGI